MLVHEGGSIDQRKTTFQANSCLLPSGSTCAADDGGVGIANQGGEVQCDELGCLPVCTSCLSPSPSPTPQPTVAKPTPQPTALSPSPSPTPQPTVAKPTPQPTALPRTALPSAVQTTGSNHRSESRAIPGLVVGSSLVLRTIGAAVVVWTIGAAVVVWRRRARRRCVGADADEARRPSHQQPLLRPGGEGSVESESVELVARSMMTSHETSPGETSKGLSGALSLCHATVWWGLSLSLCNAPCSVT